MAKIIDSRILSAMRCPCCAAGLFQGEDARSLFCMGQKRHCFDLSSAGHINLALSHSAGGDSKEAVRARRDFLNSGAYAKAAERLCDLLDKYAPENGLVIDAGCGEGYYSAQAAKTTRAVFGVDLSKDAVVSASKRASREGLENTLFGVASVFELPVMDCSADAVLNIFAPCAEAEYSRVLREGGVLLVAYAGPEHLMGLKKLIYDNTYENNARADMPQNMALVDEIRVKYRISVEGNARILDLFSMTPYYWRTSESDKQKLVGVEVLDTEVDIMIAIYKKG